MATLNGNLLNIVARAVQAGADPISGGAVGRFDLLKHPANGTADGQWDLAVAVQYSPAASATSSPDFNSIADLMGNTVSFAEVGLLIISADSANGSTISVSPNASNGWTGMFADASDIVRVSPGGALVWYAEDNQGAVTASVKVLDLTNDDGGAAATVTLYLYGRSA